MTTLKMLKVWDYNDPAAYLSQSNRFTSEDLVKYWASVDSAIRYWSVALDPAKLSSNKTAKKAFNPKRNFDKFHWKRSISRRSKVAPHQ